MNFDFIGKLHPAAVHLPIGIFFLATFLQYLVPTGKRKDDRLVRFILFCCFFSSIISTLQGWLLIHSGDYSNSIVRNHQRMAFLFSIALPVLLLIHWKKNIGNRVCVIYHTVFFITLLLLVGTIYYGNDLTHGTTSDLGEFAIKDHAITITQTDTGIVPRENELPHIKSPDSIGVIKARKKGFVVRQITLESNWLELSSVNMAKCTPEDIEMLEEISNNILWLRLSGRQISDNAMKTIAHFTNLQKLDLSNTDISDVSAVLFSRLHQLEYLNLIGTRISDVGLNQLRKMEKLKKIYCWNTPITQKGIVEFIKARPDIIIENGIK